MRLTAFLPALFLLAAAALPAAEKVSFRRDIRPILSQNCFQCHGPDKNTRLADLRLDDREQAIAKGAIRPGDPGASTVVARIRAENPALRMPPEFSNKTLSEKQKELLATWIEQGANYDKHWSYLPPQRPEAPAGPAAIDHLLNATLTEKGLEPVAEADRRTLVRRLSLDLIGLPPNPEAADEFLNDRGPQAYENLVDRLLASPQFGERLAVHWLDLVRYADSSGYHSDVAISVYPYRDYVVGAFNENMPFDRFTREQLAGDLLDQPTDRQLVASAFNRLNRMTNEGGAQAKEYLAKYAGDRVRTVSTVWLGSTLGCAECHDHKFDPFLQKDFYSMAAFFGDIEEVGVYRSQYDWGPSLRVLSDDAEQEKKRIEQQLKSLRKDESAGRKDHEEVIRYLRDTIDSWTVVEPEKALDDCSHPDIEGCDDIELKIESGGIIQAAVTGKDKPGDSVFEIEWPAGSRPISALRLEGFYTPRFEAFALSTFRAELLGRGARPMKLKFSALVADHEEPESMLRHTMDDNFHSSWNGDLRRDDLRQAMFVLDQPIEPRPGERLRVELTFNGRPNRTQLGRFRLSATDAKFPELPPVGNLQRAVVAGKAGSEIEHAALDRAVQGLEAGNPNWKEIRRLARRLKSIDDSAQECLITKRSDRPRLVRLLPRGNWMDDSGDVVDPQAPSFLSQIPLGASRPTRLDLAEWLTSRENPLTARVFVNRLWGLYFGMPLTKTPDDLGSQGEAPIHPELLDWLAVEFMESGWDVKHIVRTMMLSQAYRRSSESTPALTEADPYNRLYGRQTALRIDAEFVRDNALQVSGLLNPEMGGPSVKPYQPKGYYRELNFPKREWESDLNENQFRRGLYTHWQRTFLHPSMLAFDAAAREECTAMRTVSNTPLQSLTLLNDPTYVEAARAFGASILQSGGSDDAARIDFAFRQAFSRNALAPERETLEQFARSQRDYFQTDPSRAGAFLKVGIWEGGEALDPVELATWTSVARAVFNKHEFITRY